MQLKKILAVALAATTALSSGVAYDMLGASAKTAEAAATGVFFSKDDTFSVVHDEVTYTYKVLKPILNGEIKSGTDDKAVWATNALYDKGEAQSGYNYANHTASGGATDVQADEAGFVALTGISFKDEDTIKTKLSGNLKIYASETECTNGKFSMYSSTAADKTKGVDGGTYYVTEIDIDGDNISYGSNIKTINIQAPIGHIGSFKAKNLEGLTTINAAGSKAAFTHAGTIDVKGTKIPGLTSGAATCDIQTLFADDTKLETLNLSSMKGDPEFNVQLTTSVATSIKSVDVSGNKNFKKLTVKAGHIKGVTLNISDCTGITDIDVQNLAIADGRTAKVSSYDNPALKGFMWITDGSDTASYDLDLSFVNNASSVKINDAGLRSFTAPGYEKGKEGLLDVSFNALTSVSLSSASNASKVYVNNNKLLDCDISGLQNAGTINVSENFLTSIDTSGLPDGFSGLTASGNYIPSDNLTKSDKQTGVSIGTQNTADVFRWAYVGDIGQASGSDSKAIMKLGGTGTLVGAMVVRGAPDGFAEKLADTVKWTESNTAETSAITLGESAVVQAMETGYNLAKPGQGNLSGVVVSTAITANATKTSAEKVTLQYGNTKRDINVANDNVILVNYDIDSAIESENTKNDNKYAVAYAQFMFPTEAFILNSQGTVDATLTSTKPLAKLADEATTDITNKGSYARAIEETLKKIEGMTFTKWNTMVDGSGTATAAGAKLKGLAEDTTVYANYTENTYSISYNSTSKSKHVTVTGSTATQSGNKYGEDVTLNNNGFSTSKGNFYGWAVPEKETIYGDFYSDGQTVHGLAAKNNKTESISMQALYGDADRYIQTKESSISLVVGDAKEGAYYLADLKPSVTGDPLTDGNVHDGQSGADLGYDDGDVTYFTSDGGVVGFYKGYALAKGPGTANIYVRDNEFGNVATITVTVQSKADAAAAAELKAKQAATNKSIAAGEKTDVSDYSKFAATVVKNADGENTVTVTKGKNVKTAKINTITIGDKTYTVTRIGANAYKGMSKLTTVTTSNKVKVIGKAAFANCKKLTKVTLGKAVVKIAANAFKNDKKLAKILIKSKKLTKKARVGKNSFKGIKATAKFYIAKKAATYKKVKKAIKAQSGAPKKATYVKKYA